MREVDALVAELPPDLVHPVETAHDTLLEVQLRRDAHRHVQLQVVVVRLEGLGRGTTGDLICCFKGHIGLRRVFRGVLGVLGVYMVVYTCITGVHR